MENRHCFGPILVLGIYLEDLGTGVGLLAPAQSPIGLASIRINQDLIGEGELVLRIPTGDMLAMISARLGRPIVHENTAAAADPVQDTVENTPPVPMLVESEPQEVMHHAARLRNAVRVNE